jgi:hypothetical protein
MKKCPVCEQIKLDYIGMMDRDIDRKLKSCNTCAGMGEVPEDAEEEDAIINLR